MHGKRLVVVFLLVRLWSSDRKFRAKKRHSPEHAGLAEVPEGWLALPGAAVTGQALLLQQPVQLGTEPPMASACGCMLTGQLPGTCYWA